MYEFWSSDLLRIFKLAGIERRIPPPYESDCNINSKVSSGFPPQIISPIKEMNYVARVSSKKTNLIPFTAIHDADVRTLYWFLNETFVAKVSRDQSFLWLAKPGKYVVRVVDDVGRSDVKELRVTLAK